MQDGSVWATGRNFYGQLGDGSTITRSTFTQVVSNHAIEVAAGHSHSMMLMEGGSVWATGSNVHGQLGDGTNQNSNRFIEVFASDAKAMAVGFGHSMILTQDSNVWATGWNLYGQFGDGTVTSKNLFSRTTKISDALTSEAVTPVPQTELNPGSHLSPQSRVHPQNNVDQDFTVTTRASIKGANLALAYFVLSAFVPQTLCVLCFTINELA